MGKTEIGVYHLANSRDRVPPGGGRVNAPRHYVVFSLDPAGDGIAILGFIHERMLLSRAFRRLLER
jgi:hypothetical protein